MSKTRLSRRAFMQASAGAAAGALLAACQPQVIEKEVEVTRQVEVEKEVEVTQVVETEVEVEKIVTATPLPCEVVELRCTHAWPADQWARQVEFDEVFNQENPCVNVTGENYPWGDTVAKLTTLAAAGTLPDLIYVHYSWAQRFIMDRMILNVQPYLDTDPSFWDLDDWVEPALMSYRWQGDQWLLPYNEGPTNLIYYNKRLFDEAGVPYPHSDKKWSLEDLFIAAEQLTSGDGANKIWGYDGLPSAWNLHRDTLMPWDAEFFVEPCEVECVIDSQESVDCMSWWLELYRAGVTPTPAERETVPGEPFAYGRVAMIKGASWSNRWIKPNLEDPYDVAHAPVGPSGNRFSTTAGSAYGITKDSKHPDAAWEYLRAYNTTEGQVFLFSSIGIDPARWSAWPAYFETDATPDSAEVVMEVMEEYGRHELLDGPMANEAQNTAQAILDRLWLEELTPKEVITEIYEKCQPILDQNLDWCEVSGRAS
jgi:multiple sugar transport system substrate-binding protein